MTEANQPQGLIAGDGPVAVVDIGSNSVRLVVYERLARSPTPFFNEKVLAGLGASVAETGRLSDGAMEKAHSALRRFAALKTQMRARETHVLATAAVRTAENGSTFLKTVESIFAAPVSVLTGDEEAYVSALGIISGVTDADGIMGDLGGGSLELTDISARRVGRCESLPLGGLMLQSRSGGSPKAARRIVRDMLAKSRTLPDLAERTFYMVGGTWRSLASLHMRQHAYPLHVMHQYRMDAGELKDFLKDLARGPVESVSGIEVVSKQRQALLPYGAVVLSEMLRAGRPGSVVVSALGLREGLLYAKLSQAEQAADPLISAARELAILRARSPEHAEELIAWTDGAMAALGVDETEEEVRLRHAACLLADIGWRAHPDYRGAQSLNIIAHAGFVGIDHPGRAFLALAVYYRHAGLSEAELGIDLMGLASERYRERARLLAAIFRVAYLVSASMPGVIPRTALRRSGKRLELVLPGDLAMLAGGRLEIRLGQLAALAGLSAAVTAGSSVTPPQRQSAGGRAS